jgi:hypothetical protein
MPCFPNPERRGCLLAAEPLDVLARQLEKAAVDLRTRTPRPDLTVRR